VGADDDFRVVDNEERSRYELRVDDSVVGCIPYAAIGESIVLIHTDIEPGHEGRGFGSRLVSGALDDIRARGLTVVPVCPFVRSYLRRHPEYQDLVAHGPHAAG
jgi:predicted GNAT family acetyltransferase